MPDLILIPARAVAGTKTGTRAGSQGALGPRVARYLLEHPEIPAHYFESNPATVVNIRTTANADLTEIKSGRRISIRRTTRGGPAQRTGTYEARLGVDGRTQQATLPFNVHQEIPS